MTLSNQSYSYSKSGLVTPIILNGLSLFHTNPEIRYKRRLDVEILLKQTKYTTIVVRRLQRHCRISTAIYDVINNAVSRNTPKVTLCRAIRQKDRCRAISKTRQQVNLSTCYMQFIRAQEPKAPVTYCDHALSGVRRLSSVRLFTFSTSSPEPLDGFWWNLVWMKYSRSLTSVVVFRPDPSRGGSRAGQK